MSSWPLTLPQDVPKDGYQESPPDLLLRTQVERGPEKVRRVGRAKPRPISMALRLTDAQVQILDDFYMQDLAAGALAFDWVHPRTQASCRYRFKAPPTYTPAGNKSRFWTGSLQLEIMP